ncbi:AAA family ATPase [Peptoniphilus sp. AGMB00490]|uniref:AAA family ATPase n=1 Tax=Peptoniphilus faecalis TaxID=2731255 RepID=A0A848RH23_9FIRM|nr:AAA family ATPase [Peptoniphilus faecalis]NMW84723.1 AAA family ATPase [Peptoniphilus faecalis]
MDLLNIQKRKPIVDLNQYNFTIYGSAGVGKALRNGTPVLTTEGWIAIEDLIPNKDKVIGSDGQAYDLLGVFPQGKRQLYRVKFSDGAWVDADGDHIWTHYRRKYPDTKNPRKPLTFDLTTKELKEDLDQNYMKTSTFPTIENYDGIHKHLPIHPYLLGALIADGYLSGNNIQWTKSYENEPRVCAYVHGLVESDEIKMSMRKSNNTRNTDWVSWQHSIATNKGYGQHNQIKDRLEMLGLLNKKSKEKFIPEIYKLATKKQRLALINGLFDGDGTVRTDRPTCKYATTSKQLASDVLEVLWSLGINAHIKYMKGDNCYAVVIWDKEFNPFRFSTNKEKRELAGVKSWSNRRKVESITKVDVDEATCISVASPDKLFITKDYIVTHNTSFCSYFFDEPLFLAWEQGQNALEAYVQDMYTWKDFLEFVKELKKIHKEGKTTPFKNVIVDTVDIMRTKCEEYVCRMNGWDSPADGNYGAGWAAITREFEKRIGEVRACGLKVHFIAHDKVQRIERKDMAYDKITLQLGSTAINEVIKKVDFILYFDKEYEKNNDGDTIAKRVVRFHGGENYEAKTRISGFPEFIYAGNSAKETAQLVKKLFEEKAEALLEYDSPREEAEKEDTPVQEEKKQRSSDIKEIVTKKMISELTQIGKQKLKEKKATLDDITKIIKENTSVELMSEIKDIEEFNKVKALVEAL